MPFSPPSSITIYGRWEGWPPRVRSVGEVALSFITCNIQESRPCTLQGQQGRAGPGCRGLLVSRLQGHGELESWQADQL